VELKVGQTDKASVSVFHATNLDFINRHERQQVKGLEILLTGPVGGGKSSAAM